MKFADILSILESANIPPVPKAVIMSIVGSPAKVAFGEALNNTAAGDHSKVQFIKDILQEHAGAGVQSAPSPAIPRAHVQSPVTTQRQQPARQPAPARDPAAPPPYYSFHIYGRQAALCVSEAKTRAGHVNTVQIESAPALTAGGWTTFDWQNKIILQLTEAEMIQLLAVLERKIESVEFKGHGFAHDKSMSIAVQENSFFVKLMRRGLRADAVPVTAPDAFKIISLCYQQMRANAPHLDITIIKEGVEQVAAMHKATAARN